MSQPSQSQVKVKKEEGSVLFFSGYGRGLGGYCREFEFFLKTLGDFVKTMQRAKTFFRGEMENLPLNQAGQITKVIRRSPAGRDEKAYARVGETHSVKAQYLTHKDRNGSEETARGIKRGD